VPSRRDQIHSYQFFLHRVVSALVARETDPRELPFGRLGGAALGSVMVAVLALAAAGVYGLLVGGGASSWRDGRSVLVEKETGARFVYRDGRLHPMANIVSARLALGQDAPVQAVSSKSLLGVPRGPALGITGAPDDLPGPKRLLAGPWTLCSRIETDASGDRHLTSMLGVGRPAAGGADLGDQAALAREGDGGDGPLYLVWDGHRHEIADPDVVLVALGAGEDHVLDVSLAWLNALEPGEPIGPLRVPDLGAPSTALAGPRLQPELRAGQVLEVEGAFYLAHADELQPVTELQAQIVLADPSSAAAYRQLGGVPVARRVDPAVVAGARRGTLSQPTTMHAPAHGMPHVVGPRAEDHRDGAVCASFQPGSFEPRVLIGARLPEADGAAATPQRTEEGGVLASRVLVEPGWAALVEALPSPDAPAGPLHLVTDLGVRHSLPDRAVAGMLGYGTVQPVRLPADLVARIPAGPVLDPAAARSPVAMP
jgi:type VII secretion protein EccB